MLGVPVEMQTEHLPNRCVECYRYTDLLGMQRSQMQLIVGSASASRMRLQEVLSAESEGTSRSRYLAANIT
jgi:hypothetical protein